MDKLVETIAEYLCRHRSVGLFRLTLDVTRRRLDLFAEVGAVEVVKGVVSPPTPGTETWWWAVAAVREAVYAGQEGAGPVHEGGGGGQLDRFLLKNFKVDRRLISVLEILHHDHSLVAKVDDCLRLNPP